MPPKATRKMLHQLAAELPQNSVITDTANKKQYCIGKQFASGGFGRIYTCKEIGSKKELAIKVEPFGNGPLFTEVNVFVRILKQDQIEEFLRRKKLNRLGVPQLISCGIHHHGGEKLRFLVMPMYAISLENIREKSPKLAAFDVWKIARCMLESLEYIHEKNYTHADIKAANILLERPNDFSSCVLVDYGLARMSSSNEDRPLKQRAHNGTPLFTSCDAHRGCHPSYRGDLEILAYNIMYWLNGSLPWQTYESNLTKIHQLKEALLSDVPSNLKKHLKENCDSIAPLRDIFTVVRKTEYRAHLDFPVLYKIVDNAMKKFHTSGRKRGNEEPLSESLEVDESKTVKRNKFEIETKSEKNENQCVAPDTAFTHGHCSINVAQHKTSPTVPQLIKANRPHVHIRRPARSSLSSNVSLKNELQSTRSSKQLVTFSSSVELSSASRTREKGSIGQGCSVKQSPTRSKNLSPTLSNDVKIPALSIRRAPCSSVNLKPSYRVKIDDASAPAEKSVKAPAEKVSSDVKRSPNKLRKIPGMQNFRRGRRSIVIDQITKKYQKMAQDKHSRKS